MTPSERRRDLLRDRLGALYCTDSDGRIAYTNEWDRRPPPRFHLMRTEAGPIYQWSKDLPDAIVRRLENLVGLEPPDQWSARLPLQYQQFVETLAAHAPVTRVWSGPAYMSAKDPRRDRAPLPIDDQNAELLRKRFEDWMPDVPYRRPFMAVLEGGDAAAICASVRISEAVHCAGVATDPACQRKGYALDAVAGWARAVRSLGATPFYSTSWDNIASQRVAVRLGFDLAAVDFHIT